MKGSLAPLIAISLLNGFHSSAPISLYLVAAVVISMIAVGLAKETAGKSLHTVDAEAGASTSSMTRDMA
ncbi:hypothetical protein AB0N05_12410 [Nocardia sp. NPDC051030]|uniref:hypothetical protein n=1 Tax=Nocardia sp. NPDC051030 TaxID=3155162 RepID=UPI00342C7EAF